MFLIVLPQLHLLIFQSQGKSWWNVAVRTKLNLSQSRVLAVSPLLKLILKWGRRLYSFNSKVDSSEKRHLYLATMYRRLRLVTRTCVFFEWINYLLLNTSDSRISFIDDMIFTNNYNKSYKILFEKLLKIKF